MPRDGLVEGYHRLAYDDLSREALTWGVIESLFFDKLSVGCPRGRHRS